MAPEEEGIPKVYIVGARMFEDRLRQYAQDLDRVITGQARVTYVDIESSEGAQLAELLDIESDRLPAVLILEDDDSVYKDWYGEDLPDPETVAYELGQITGSSPG